jgi:hypothetical protein
MIQLLVGIALGWAAGALSVGPHPVLWVRERLRDLRSPPYADDPEDAPPAWYVGPFCRGNESSCPHGVAWETFCPHCAWENGRPVCPHGREHDECPVCCH